MTKERKSKPRRPQGEGTIVQRADGLFMFSVRLGKDLAGKPKRKYLYAKTRAELKRKIADETARGGGALRVRTKRTVAEWVEQWLEQKKPNIAKTTYSTWALAWRNHAAPLIGTIRLDDFDPQDVAEFYGVLQQKGTGGRAVQVVAQVMRAAFEAAIDQEVLHRTNAWRKVKVPRHKTKEARALNAGESRNFIDAARSDRYEALWLLCILAGLRFGEALGLEWSDVDLTTGVVKIRQQLMDTSGTVEVTDLKTDSSRRQFEVGAIALEALRRRQAASIEERHGSSFVFTTAKGEHPNRGNIRRRNFADVCERAGLGHLRIHDLRHTMTAHAMEGGVPVVVVAARLGHGSTRMTLNRYGHVLPGQQREAAGTIEGRLGLQPDSALENQKISNTTSKKVVVTTKAGKPRRRQGSKKPS